MITMKKTFSIILVVIMLLSAAPIALAAEPTLLSAENVVAWPAANGEIYFGQKISDGVTLSGGMVTLDGTESGTIIPGTFEFVDPNLQPTSASTSFRASIRFVPNDSENYTGFEVTNSKNVTFTINKATPVLVDEVNDPPVATEVEAGAKLSASTLSGGKVINPYNPEESKALAGFWRWTNTSTVVNESGYYQARMVISGYEIIYYDVWVQIAGEVPETSIETNPTANITYDPNLKWGDVVLEGGKAVIKGTTTEVIGTFAVTDKWKNITPSTTNTKVEVTFTPDDETQALPYTFEIPVTVNKAVPTFKTDDESGIPTITMPYGTKLDSSLNTVIKSLIDVNVPVSLAYKDLEGNDLPYSGATPTVGTHEIQILVGINDSNYEKYTMLTFNLEVTGFTANCIMVPVGTEGYKIIDESLAYNAAKPTGTYTVSYTVDGEKQPDITVKYEELFQVEKTKSGKYEYSIKYNEIENDPFEIADFSKAESVVLTHSVTINGQKQSADYNTTVTALAPATDPEKADKPFYGFKGWTDVNGNTGLTEEELKSAEITFAMPDGDVDLDATYAFSFLMLLEFICTTVVSFFASVINSLATLF